MPRSPTTERAGERGRVGRERKKRKREARPHAPASRCALSMSDGPRGSHSGHRVDAFHAVACARTQQPGCAEARPVPTDRHPTRLLLRPPSSFVPTTLPADSLRWLPVISSGSFSPAEAVAVAGTRDGRSPPRGAPIENAGGIRRLVPGAPCRRRGRVLRNRKEASAAGVLSPRTFFRTAPSSVEGVLCARPAAAGEVGSVHCGGPGRRPFP